jgi:hypothetical protein
MKIGMKLKELFTGLQVDGVDVQYHFGDQKELNMWIASKMKSNKQKYPLIWYVVSPPEPQGNGSLRVKTSLILFQGTKSELFNTERYTKTYLTYIEPLYELVQKTLYESRLIRFDAYNGIPYRDEPNYGIESSSLDFSSISTQKQKSITVDIVDAKVMDLQLEIKLTCNGGN